MSTARFGAKWADLDEDEDDVGNDAPKNETRFETQADKDGIKMVIEYIERDGKTYKVTKKVKQTSQQKWSNMAIDQRKGMVLFGKASAEDAKHITKSPEEVSIEISKKQQSNAAVGQDLDEKFYHESITLTENLFKEKKVWTEMNRDKQEERDKLVGVDPPDGEQKAPEPGSLAEVVSKNSAGGGDAGGAAGATRYVPPSLRGTAGQGGKGTDGRDQGQEASLRVFNLSEDVKEGDLQELFGQFGRLQRVYLAKHMDTFQSKGFAFITYYNRDDGQRAINKLNGHGYDNLIMKVEWAKPRTT